MDKPMKLTVTVEVTVNSSDGTRQDALDHLWQMISYHGLAGIQMGALEPVAARIQRSDYEFTLTNDQARIAQEASL
jgi:hypothetical protein